MKLNKITADMVSRRPDQTAEWLNRLKYNVEEVESNLIKGVGNKDLVPATTTRLGGIIVGDNLTITSWGRLSAVIPAGITTYAELPDKPSINNVTLEGNKTLSELGIDIPTSYWGQSAVGGVVGGTITLTDGGKTATISTTGHNSSIAGISMGNASNYIEAGVTTTSVVSNTGNVNLKPKSGSSVDVFNAKIINLANPTNNNDAANKYYVDTGLSTKQDTLVAGNNINIAADGKTISAVVPTKTSDLLNDGSDGTSTYVEADELATVATSGSYTDLINKPTIGNATLTIQKNSTDVGTFTANATSNKTIDISVPTQTSDITNNGADGTSTYVEADELATVATSGSYTDLLNKPTIGNATLTIQKNGTSAGTFTANATSNETINITVPTTAADVNALPDSTKYAASLSLTINSSTFVVTGQLKDQDGNNLGTAQTIDLPLESVVVSGSYDSATKEVVLVLESGSEIRFSVADLVSGLQSEITSANPLDADLVDDSTSTNKFVTAADITKLNGIQAGAEVNVQSNWTEADSTSDAYILNKPSLATVATSGDYNDLSNKPTIGNATLTIQKNGTTIDAFTANATSNKTISIPVPTKVSELENDENYISDDTQEICGDGASYTLSGTTGAPLDAHELKGDASQQTYTGKNIFSGDWAQFDNTGGTGTTYAYFKLPTNDQYYWYMKAKNAITPGSHYIGFSYNGGNADTAYKWIYQNNTATAGQVFQGSNQVSGNICQYVFMYPKTEANLEWFNENFELIQIEKGSVATSYEPYVGGVPSPNPDYPQDIQVVTGEQTIKVTGKNLFDRANASENIVLKWLDAGDNTENKTISGDYIATSEGQQFSSNFSMVIFCYNASKVYLGTIQYNETLAKLSGKVAQTITIPSGYGIKYVRIEFRTSYNGNLDMTQQNIMVNLGDTPEAYEPYQGQSYTIDLGSTELCGIGKKPDGTYTCQDYIWEDGADWKVHKAVGKAFVSLNSQVYTLTGGLKGSVYSPAGKYSNAIALCDRAIQTSGSGTLWPGCFYNNPANFMFVGASTDDSASLKAKYDGATLYFMLATPTDTAITDEMLISQLDALWDAHGYDDTTNVSVLSASPTLPAQLEACQFASHMPIATDHQLGTVIAGEGLTIEENGKLNVDTSEIQEKLTAGTNIDLVSNTISTQTRGIEYIVGTQASATNLWTGVSTDNGCSSGTLYTGKTIAYYLPVAGNSSAATLNLTLPDGTTTGGIALRRTGGSTVTTHFGVNNVIVMTYDGTYWKVSAYYDSTNTSQLRNYNSVKAASAISDNVLTGGTSTGYVKLVDGATFDITYPLLWFAAGSSLAAGGTSSAFWHAYDGRTLRNNKSGWTGTAYQLVYLVGTLSGTTFTVGSDVFTQTAPTTEDGKTYVPIGVTYSTYQIYYYSTNEYWQYKNGEFRPISHTPAVMAGADSGTAGTSGLVPAPAAGDNTKYLSGDGTWKTVSQYALPIASSSTLGGVKVGDGLAIDSGTGVLSVDDKFYINVTGVTPVGGSTTQYTFTADQTFQDIYDAYDAGKLPVLLVDTALWEWNPNTYDNHNYLQIPLSYYFDYNEDGYERLSFIWDDASGSTNAVYASNIAFGFEHSGGSYLNNLTVSNAYVLVDSSLNSGSTNAVQNNVVTNALASKVENFLITVTNIDADHSTFTADKTWAQIKTAYDAGKTLVLKFTDPSYDDIRYILLDGYYHDSNQTDFHFFYSYTQSGQYGGALDYMSNSYMKFDFYELYGNMYTAGNGTLRLVTSLSSRPVSTDDVANGQSVYDALANKADSSSIGNATLTIQKNGTTVNTFTANQSTNATANITVPTKTSDITNDSGFITSGSTQSFAAQEGSTNPVFDDMTPLSSFEWDIADTTYRAVYQMDNTGWAYDTMDVTVAYRITVTGSGISQVADIIDRWHSPNTRPVTSILNRTLSTSAGTTGFRYLRAVYPTASYINNTTYPMGQEISAYNATARHIKVEVFKDSTKAIWNTTKPTASIYKNSSTYQGTNSIETYATRGWIFRGAANVAVNSADTAACISDYERYSPGSSALKSGATALVAGHFAFLAEDGLVYDISNTAKAISVGESKVGWISTGINANTDINQSYWRMISRPNATQYGYFSHDTMALGDRVYLRCTMDSSGKIHSDNYLAKSMSPGYTWMPMGFMTAATTFYADTRFPKFYTLDADGNMTHMDGIPLISYANGNSISY